MKQKETKKRNKDERKKSQQNNLKDNDNTDNKSSNNAYVLNMAYFSKVQKRLSFNKTKSFQTRSKKMDKTPETLTERKKLEDQTHFLDRISRLAFPVTYALFCIVYFAYYITDATQEH